MNINRNKDKEEQPISIRNTPIALLRSSGLKLDERTSDLYLLRNSYSSGGLRNLCQIEPSDFRHSILNSTKKKQMQTLKSTLDKLENKVNAVKEQLQGPSISMKKKPQPLIHYEEDLETSKTYDRFEPNLSPTDSSITIKKQDKKFASLVTNIAKPKNFQPSYSNPYSPRRHGTYYISQAMRAVNEKNSLIVQHITASIRIMKQCEPYEIPSMGQMTQKRLNLKKSDERKKKTLVLDLDETLIHCVDNYESECDLRLSIRLEKDDNRTHQFGINIRPYALTFLKKMSKKFEIVIFTASQQEYADAILDQLDPEGQIFDHRLYRQHCWVLDNQMHVKDIRMINRNLSEVVLVDNAAYSYCFQLQNGIPILPYYQGSDYQLAALQAYLDELDRCSDVRELNKQTFKLHHYTKFKQGQQLIEQLYMKNFS